MSEVPTRKRRRPVLSCVECRRRKIKCDRRVPCNHCTQLKIMTCTYPDNHSTVLNRHNVPKTSTTSLSANNHLASPGVPASISVMSEAQFSQQNPTPRSLPSLVNGFHSETRSLGSNTVYTTDDSHSERNVQNLVNRPRNLEQLPLSSASRNKDTDEVMSILGVEFSSFGDVILQVGGNHPTAKVFEQSNSTTMQHQTCNFDRTQFFGRSHWMNTFNMFSRVCRYKDKYGKLVTGTESGEVREALEKYRRLAKVGKAEKIINRDTGPNFMDYIPPRELADKLLELYLRTCESTYRILHIPSLRKEYAHYWSDSSNVSTTSVAKILLVMAIGTVFYQGDGDDQLRRQAQRWVYSVQSWVASPFEEVQLNISWIQIHCLILLSRQTNAVGQDLAWLPSGNLLRMAFSMGFHRDPKHFPKLSIFVAEMRRRIWATVLEMAVQTSMDVGMPPLISSNDFDTEPPSNIDDEDIFESTTVMPSPKPNYVYTQTSIQITLIKSLCTRLEIVQFINSFHSEPSYEEVLRFSQDITRACNEATRLIQSYPCYQRRPTAFQSNILDIFVRRFLLEAHRPFFVRSQTDPRYYFSRKVCLENALVLFFLSGSKDLPPDHEPQIVDDYERLKRVGRGLFKSVFFLAITVITVELMLQLEEDITSGLPPSFQTKTNREPLYQAIEDMVKLTTERVRMGDNNEKGPVFISAAAALIRAMTNGVSPEQVVPEAAIRSANECLEILRAKTKAASHDSGVQNQPENNASEASEASGNIGEPDFGFDLLMPDANMDFGMQDGNLGFSMQDSWLFTNWDAN